MKKLTMDKVITVIDTTVSTMQVSVHQYKELSEICENEKRIEVTYPLGLQKRRQSQLEAINFKLEKELHHEATEKHHSVKEVWVKEGVLKNLTNADGKEVVVIREVGTSALIEGDNVQINQMKWDVDSEFDYNSIFLTKEEIVALAAHIQLSEHRNAK